MLSCSLDFRILRWSDFLKIFYLLGYQVNKFIYLPDLSCIMQDL